MAYEQLLGAGALGIFAAFGAVAMGFALIVYLYASFAVMKIADKLKTPNSWLAFIPIANVYLMTQMAGLPAWYTLAIFLPIIPFIGGLAMMVVMVYFWWIIAEKIGKPNWWSILLLIPIVNLVVIGLMAWQK